MTQIEWSRTAENEFLAVLAWYIEQDDKALGQKIASRLLGAIGRLTHFPHSGRQGLIPDTRELVIPDLPYFAVYRVTDKVEILRVMHTSRLWVEK